MGDNPFLSMILTFSIHFRFMSLAAINLLIGLTEGTQAFFNRSDEPVSSTFLLFSGMTA